jgi:hypothetical protein
MAEPKAGSKTVASIYTNRKDVERVQVMFDANKLSVNDETGHVTLPKSLVEEITSALQAKRS